MHMMSSTPHRTSTAPNEWRTTVELALLVSTVAATLAFALSWFARVDEAPIVLLTVVAASVIGWRQPAARVDPARIESLEASGQRPAC